MRVGRRGRGRWTDASGVLGVLVFVPVVGRTAHGCRVHRPQGWVADCWLRSVVWADAELASPGRTSIGDGSDQVGHPRGRRGGTSDSVREGEGGGVPTKFKPITVTRAENHENHERWSEMR